MSICLFSYCSLYNLVRITSSHGFACLEKLENTQSIFHKTSELTAYKHEALWRDYLFSSGFTSTYDDLNDWTEQIGFEHPSPLTPVCYRGSFATTVAMIHSRGGLWKKLEDSLSRGDNIEEAHFAERSWAALLSHHIGLKASSALVKASTRTLGTKQDKDSRKRGFWGPLSGCDNEASFELEKDITGESTLEWLDIAFQGSHSYTVCNGLSNQLLAHAGNIAYAITHKLPLLIPDAFIVNGVQTSSNKDGTSLLDVTPSNSDFVKVNYQQKSTENRVEADQSTGRLTQIGVD